MSENFDLNRRQPYRRSTTSDRSSVTVDSYELRVRSDDDEENQGISSAANLRSSFRQSIHINSSNDVVVGNPVTVIYNYNSVLTKDASNPAFYLSDSNIGVDKKLVFILKQKWFWIVLILFVVLIFIFYAIGTLLSVLTIQSILADWNKLDPKPGLEPLDLPVTQVIAVYTADQTECCTTSEECVQRLQAMQILYMLYLKDIPFNFMVGCDGTVYIGRGFQFRGEIFELPVESDSLVSAKRLINNTAATSLIKYQAPKALAAITDENIFVVAFIGDFSEQSPSEDQLRTFANFLSRSVSRDMMANNYTLVTEKQLETLNNSADALTVALSNFSNFYKFGNIIPRNEWMSAKFFQLINMTKANTFLMPVDEASVELMNFTCRNMYDCQKVLESLLARDLANGFYDLRYNFYISEVGIFTGRGFNDTSEDCEFASLPNRLFIGFLNSIEESLDKLVTLLDYLLTEGTKINVTSGSIVLELSFSADCFITEKTTEDLRTTTAEPTTVK